MIYLASPYSHDSELVREQRFAKACRAAAFFMAAGEHVYSPIAHSHPIAMAGDLPKGWDYWQAYDRWFIQRCDEVRVLMLPGWEASVGVAAEIEMAKDLGKPVTYWLMVDGAPRLADRP